MKMLLGVYKSIHKMRLHNFAHKIFIHSIDVWAQNNNFRRRNVTKKLGKLFENRRRRPKRNTLIP